MSHAALPVAGAVLLGLTLFGLSLHVPHAVSVGSVALTNRFVAIAVLAGAVYLAACALVLRATPPRAMLWVVLGVAPALRLPVLAAPAFAAFGQSVRAVKIAMVGFECLAVACLVGLLLDGLGELRRLPHRAAAVYFLVCAAGLLAASLRLVARDRAVPPPACDTVRLCRRAGWLSFAFLFLLSPHYSWYFPFLAVFATVAPAGAVIWLSVAPLLLDLEPFADPFYWRALVFVPALLLAAGDALSPPSVGHS